MAKRQLGKFKCPKCDRVFAMPAHLARHVNSAHGAGGKSKKAQPKLAAGKGGHGAFQVPALGGADATHMLNQMQNYRMELLAQRDAVEGQIQAIDNALHAFGAAAPARGGMQPVTRGRRGPRGPRAGSLQTYIENVLKSHGKPMAVKDITDAVMKAGFNTKNKTLGKSVGITLTKMPNVRRVSRGIFNMK